MSMSETEIDVVRQAPSEEDVLLARVRAPTSRVGIFTKPRDFVFTDELKVEYLRLLSHTGVLSQCAKAINLNPSTIRTHRKTDKEFAKDVEEALELFRDKVDLAVYHRGVVGVLEDVYHQGVVVGQIRKYSDSMLAMFAKRHNSAYREKVEVDATVRAALVVTQPQQSIEEMQAAADRIARASNASG